MAEKSEMVWTCEKGKGRPERGGEGESWKATASGKAWEIVEWVCGGGYELVRSGGTCGAGWWMWKAFMALPTPS